jgi:hypothetical protein
MVAPDRRSRAWARAGPSDPTPPMLLWPGQPDFRATGGGGRRSGLFQARNRGGARARSGIGPYSQSFFKHALTRISLRVRVANGDALIQIGREG